MLIRRRLAALGLPNVDPDDEASVVRAVTFLEDRKVRALPIERRQPLRTRGPGWNAAFLEYLKELDCPAVGAAQESLSPDERKQAILWLTGHAVGLEFEDNGTRLNTAAEAAMRRAAGGESDGNGEDSEAGIPDAIYRPLVELRELLGVNEPTLPAEGRPADVAWAQKSLQVCSRRLRLQVLSFVTPTGEPLPDDEAVAPEDLDALTGKALTGNVAVDRAAAVLRVLYLVDLREMQDRVNELLELAQEFTADPKTDTSLGKVGR